MASTNWADEVEAEEAELETAPKAPEPPAPDSRGIRPTFERPREGGFFLGARGSREDSDWRAGKAPPPPPRDAHAPAGRAGHAAHRLQHDGPAGEDDHRRWRASSSSGDAPHAATGAQPAGRVANGGGSSSGSNTAEPLARDGKRNQGSAPPGAPSTPLPSELRAQETAPAGAGNGATPPASPSALLNLPDEQIKAIADRVQASGLDVSRHYYHQTYNLLNSWLESMTERVSERVTATVMQQVAAQLPVVLAAQLPALATAITGAVGTQLTQALHELLPPAHAAAAQAPPPMPAAAAHSMQHGNGPRVGQPPMSVVPAVMGLPTAAAGSPSPRGNMVGNGSGAPPPPPHQRHGPMAAGMGPRGPAMGPMGCPSPMVDQHHHAGHANQTTAHQRMMVQLPYAVPAAPPAAAAAEVVSPGAHNLNPRMAARLGPGLMGQMGPMESNSYNPRTAQQQQRMQQQQQQQHQPQHQHHQQYHQQQQHHHHHQQQQQLHAQAMMNPVHAMAAQRRQQQLQQQPPRQQPTPQQQAPWPVAVPADAGVTAVVTAAAAPQADGFKHSPVAGKRQAKVKMGFQTYRPPGARPAGQQDDAVHAEPPGGGGPDLSPAGDGDGSDSYVSLEEAAEVAGEAARAAAETVAGAQEAPAVAGAAPAADVTAAGDAAADDSVAQRIGQDAQPPGVL